MILYEYEGKELLKSGGIPVPASYVLHSIEGLEASGWNTFPCVLKAQVLSGKRGLRGGIKFANDSSELAAYANELFQTRICDDITAAILIEEKCTILDEWYLSYTYSTQSRSPVLLFSFFGGSLVEDKKEVYELPINSLRGFEEFRVRNFFLERGIQGKDLLGLISVTQKLYTLFVLEDARLVEINPLVRKGDGDFVALDCKMMLDDDASYRHRWQYAERPLFGRLPTERERAVKAIDQGEFYYRGTAGKYIELEGDIACLFSGGGASISMMDALYAAGGKPGNYTEYSGNPPREKVYELAKIVFSKPGLKGIWIVGGVANFTHIGETMAGIADALGELQPSIPIVVRRAGPFEDQGRSLMEAIAREKNLNLSWYGREVSMTDTAKILMDKIVCVPIVETTQ